MSDERGQEISAPEVKMPEKIKALWDVAKQSGFVAAKGEFGGGYRFIATKGGNEVWLTINPDGSKIDRLQTVDLKTGSIIGHEDGETIQKWVDLLAGAGVNAKEGLDAYLWIEPIRSEFYVDQARLKGIGVTFQERKTGSGKFQPASLGLIKVA